MIKHLRGHRIVSFSEEMPFEVLTKNKKTGTKVTTLGAILLF